MPFIYLCLLDWNEQIWVSHVQFEIPPVSSRGSRPGCLLGGIDTVLATGSSPNLVI